MDENNQIQFTNLTLDSAFQKFYTVPDYQREYVWKEEQVEQLLADITHPAQSSFGKLSRDDTVDLYSLSSHRLKQWGQLGEILGGVRFPEDGASHWSV